MLRESLGDQSLASLIQAEDISYKSLGMRQFQFLSFLLFLRLDN